jgi:YD repeat-containing protein
LAGVYQQLLERPADPAGLQYWVGQLDNGVSRMQVVGGIEHSAEARQVQVRDLYKKLLGRVADSAGVQFFTAQLEAGVPLAAVEGAIMASPEYQRSRGDHTTADFLASTFHDVLGRAIDPNALVAFGQVAGASGNLAAAQAVASSAEAAGKLVEQNYQKILQRSADPAGLAFWTSVVQQGGSDALSAGLLASPEYQQTLRDPASLTSMDDPLNVLDANKGIVLTAGYAQNDFASWAVDLRAQVSGSTISTYSWDLSGASLATSVSGSSTYRLQFTWGSPSTTSATQTIVLTATDTSSVNHTETLTFTVWKSTSAYYASTPVTTYSTWNSVQTPDLVAPGQATVGGQYYALGENDGAVMTSHALPSYSPNVAPLVFDYSSTAADARPIFVTHYVLDPSRAVPSTITAQLTLNGTAGSVIYYDTSLLNPGDIVSIPLQGNATSLATGRYSYEIDVTANYGTPVTTPYTGSVNIVNEGSSPYGSGWTLSNVQKLYAVTGGVFIEGVNGTSLWFASSGSSYVTPADDSSTLVHNGDGTYTRTLKNGTAIHFNSSGQETSVVDLNGNTTSYSYTSGLLTSITDPRGQATSLGYTSGLLTSITDPASRTTSLAYGSGHLTDITDADSSEWDYVYDSAGRLTSIEDPRAHTTSFTYGAANRVSGVTRADSTTESLTAAQVRGIPASGTGTSGSPATAYLATEVQATYVDPNGQDWFTRVDWIGYGAATQTIDPLGDETVVYRKDCGCPWLITDPLGRITRRFEDSLMNLTEVAQPDGSTLSYTYNSLNEVLTSTDATGYTTTNTYDSAGNLLTVTQPDPDGSGPLSAPVTTYTYTSHGMAATMTDPNGNETFYTYNSYDELTQITYPDGDSDGADGPAVTMAYSSSAT